MSATFRVGVTRDFLGEDGTIGYGDIGLSRLEQTPNLSYEFLAENTSEIAPDQIREFDGLLVLSPKLTQASLQSNDQLKVVARFGVGYDSVDVPACTENGTLLTITPKAVKHPVAVSALTLLLSLSHRILIKDQLTRSGNWNKRLNHMGQGLVGRTLGIVGVGNIGQELFRIVQPLGMNLVGFDPYTKPEAVADLGVSLLPLDEVLRQSDYLVLCCTLTPETHHLIDQNKIALMKSTAFLINVSRGPVIDQSALHTALNSGQLQGAGLDVFEQEPVDPNDPLLALDNVILAPHSLCWTDQFFSAIGQEACQSIIDVASGIQPEGIVNPAALEHTKLELATRPPA